MWLVAHSWHDTLIIPTNNVTYYSHIDTPYHSKIHLKDAKFPALHKIDKLFPCPEASPLPVLDGLPEQGSNKNLQSVWAMRSCPCGLKPRTVSSSQFCPALASFRRWKCLEISIHIYIELTRSQQPKYTLCTRRQVSRPQSINQSIYVFHKTGMYIKNNQLKYPFVKDAIKTKTSK